MTAQPPIPSPTLTERWTLTARALSEAERAAGLPSARLVEFREYLDNNELELAWDALASLVESNDRSALAWFHLAHAARLMDLRDHVERAVRAMVDAWPAWDADYRLGYVLVVPSRRTAS